MEKTTDPHRKIMMMKKELAVLLLIIASLPLIDDGLAAAWPFVSASMLEMQTDLGCQMQMKTPDGEAHLTSTCGRTARKHTGDQLIAFHCENTPVNPGI